MIYLLTSIIRFPWWWHIITVVICTTLKHFPWMPWPKWHASHQHPRQPFERPTVSSMRPKCASPKARLHLYHHAKMPWLRHAPSRFSLETRLWEKLENEQNESKEHSVLFCIACPFTSFTHHLSQRIISRCMKLCPASIWVHHLRPLPSKARQERFLLKRCPI